MNKYLKVYEVRYEDNDVRMAYVAALNPSQAKYLAIVAPTCRFYGEDYKILRAKRYPDLDFLIDISDPLPDRSAIDKPQWLFDNETYYDMMEQERRWFDSQCL